METGHPSTRAVNSGSVNQALHLQAPQVMHATALVFSTCSGVMPGFHSNARNARKALRKEKYASKIKSAQETQQTQENYASQKQKYASASHATDASGHCARKRNDRIDTIFHATHASVALRALLAFEWKPGLSDCLSVRTIKPEPLKIQSPNSSHLESLSRT